MNVFAAVLLAQAATPTPPALDPNAGEAAGSHVSVIKLIMDADPVVKVVMLLLLVASIACWAIIAIKLSQMRKAKRQSEAFLQAFWNSEKIEDVYKNAERYGDSPLSEVFRSGYVELVKITESGKEKAQSSTSTLEGIDRAMKRARRTEVTQLSKAVPFLATTGSSSPFIGLFGTVWGIMNSFMGLVGSQGDTTIQAVAPGIAEALIATAIGLVAAIPAVIFYNLLSTRIKVLAAEMDNFAGDFLNIIDRHYL